MSRQSASITIARPPRVVFAYMDDVSREGEWQPSLKSAEQSPPGPTVVGTHKRYVSEFMGREIKNTYVVTALEPGRRVVYETTKDSSVDARSEVVCEPAQAGTAVTMLIEAKPRGFLRLMPATVLEAASRQELQSALERLKATLEGRGGPGEG